MVVLQEGTRKGNEKETQMTKGRKSTEHEYNGDMVLREEKLKKGGKRDA